MAASVRHLRITKGFTLLEVMLSLLLIGIAAGYVVFNVLGESHTDQLEKQARRLQVIVEMASDYAILNQQQLGIRFEEKDNQYYFVYLDNENEWQQFEDSKVFAAHSIPEPFTFELNIDDLPWDAEDSLFEGTLFDETLSVSEDGVEIGNEEDKKLPPPQILIMSSGDITPFTLSLVFDGDRQNDPVFFALLNQDVPPLDVQGPLEAPL